MDERALVVLAQRLAPVTQEVVARVKSLSRFTASTTVTMVSSRATSDRLSPRLVAELEGGRHGKRLGDARRLDQQIVEAPLACEATHLRQEVVAQRAANAAVRHFNKRFLRAVKLGVGTDQISVDIHLGHTVDDDGNPASFTIVQNAVQQSRFSCTKKAGEHGDRKAGVVSVQGFILLFQGRQ